MALVDLLSLVLSTSFHTTPLETVRAAFPHTACGRALVPAVLGGLRVLDGASQAMESEVPEVLPRPGRCDACIKAATRALDAQAAQPLVHVRVDLVEALRGIPGAEVRSPSSEDRVELGDHLTEVRVAS